MQGLSLKSQSLNARTLKPRAITLTFSAITLALALSGCSAQHSDTAAQAKVAPNAMSAQIISQNASNPFFNPYDTFMEIPAFDKIKPEHFLPAFKAGIAQQHEEIQAIVDNKDKPTFANTIVVVTMTGAELMDYLAAAARMPPASPRFPGSVRVP